MFNITRLLSVIILVFSLSKIGIAGEIVLDGKSYPDPVDLRREFSQVNHCQQGGLCHIFAAAAIYEAACWRRLHKHVEVSEAYLFYRHLRNLAHDTGFSLDDFESAPGSDYSEDGSIFGDADAGRDWRSISRMFNGSACTERELPFDKHFLKQILAIRTTASAIWKKTGDGSEAVTWMCRKLDDVVKCDLQSNGSAVGLTNGSPGWTADTKDQLLLACMNQPMTMYHGVDWDTGLVLKLLSSGKPFVCNGLTDFNDGSGSGGHALVIIGYRFNKKFAHNIEFLARDTNDQFPSWGWDLQNECSHGITYID